MLARVDGVQPLAAHRVAQLPARPAAFPLAGRIPAEAVVRAARGRAANTSQIRLSHTDSCRTLICAATSSALQPHALLPIILASSRAHEEKATQEPAATGRGQHNWWLLPALCWKQQ